MTRPLSYVVLLATCIGSCATPSPAPAWLCGSYESPPKTFEFVREDGQRDSWERTQYLSLRDDGTCCLSYGSGAYPIGRWVVDMSECGSKRVLVWPVGPDTIGEPTPADQFILFTVVDYGGHVDLVRDGETWTRQCPAR
jgi:hypothetical protein